MSLNTETEDLGRHPMKVVLRRTGLKADLVRAWERRYEAVTPSRSGSGRRLYSDSDVQRLQLLRQAVEAGRRIGDVASLPVDDLERLVEEDFQAERDRSLPLPSQNGQPTGEATIDTLMSLLRRSDAIGFERALRIAERQRTPREYVDLLISPLVVRIGSASRNGELRIFQEHLATAVLRGRLSCLLLELQERNDGPRLILTTPVGQIHELGALIAGVVAAAEGWSVLYLGVNLPAEEIAAAARQQRARLVALSLVHPADDHGLVHELRRLRQMLPQEVPICLGGRAAAPYFGAMKDRKQVYRFDSMSGFVDELRRRRDR